MKTSATGVSDSHYCASLGHLGWRDTDRIISIGITGNSYGRGGLSTVGLRIKIGCFVKKKNVASVWKGADLNWLVQGGQLYRSFPFSKDSLGQGKYACCCRCHFCRENFANGNTALLVLVDC